MIARLEEIAHTWSHLLELSGEALNFKKCSWYILYREWEKGRPQLRPMRPSDPIVKLHSSHSDLPPTTISRKQPNEAQRMLGVYLTPNGDFSTQLKLYKGKANTFAARLHSPRLKTSDIRIFHRSIYIPTMHYGLSATVATAQELQHIQSNVIATMLQRMHISSKIPTASYSSRTQGLRRIRSL